MSHHVEYIPVTIHNDLNGYAYWTSIELRYDTCLYFMVGVQQRGF